MDTRTDTTLGSETATSPLPFLRVLPEGTVQDSHIHAHLLGEGARSAPQRPHSRCESTERQPSSEEIRRRLPPPGSGGWWLCHHPAGHSRFRPSSKRPRRPCGHSVAMQAVASPPQFTGGHWLRRALGLQSSSRRTRVGLSCFKGMWQRLHLNPNGTGRGTNDLQQGHLFAAVYVAIGVAARVERSTSRLRKCAAAGKSPLAAAQHEDAR